MINPQQVKNITGHIATGAATAIAILGLQAKGFDAVKITAAINALGDVVNNLIIFAGFVGGAIAAYKSVTGSGTVAVTQQAAQAINADPKAATALLSTETKTALAEATVAVAANSRTANTALLDGVASLENVKGVVTDKATESATTSPLVTSDPKKL